MAPPPPPPPARFPFTQGSKPKRRLSWSSLGQASNTRDQLIRHSSHSPTSTLTSLPDNLTFVSDSEKYDEIPVALSEIPKNNHTRPEVIHSNITMATKKSPASSKWGYGWGVGKKREEKDSGVDMASDMEEKPSPTTSQTNLPLYSSRMVSLDPPLPPPPIIYPFTKGSRPKRRLSWSGSGQASQDEVIQNSSHPFTPPPDNFPDNLTFTSDSEKYDEIQLAVPEVVKDGHGHSDTSMGVKRSTTASKWGYGWGVGKKRNEEDILVASDNEEKQGPIISQVHLPLYSRSATSTPPPPLPPPPICFPFVGGPKPKRRLSWSRSGQGSQDQLIQHSSHSPTPPPTDFPGNLTFVSDSEKYNEIQLGLPEAPKGDHSHSRMVRSNTMTGTKRSTPSSKWGYGWGVGKKQSEKEMGMASETEKEQSPVASQTNLPLYNKTQQSKSTFASKFPQRAQDTHQIRHAQLPRRPLVGPNNSTSTLVGSALDRKAEVDPIKGADKLKKLREHMATRNLAYYIVPSENVHGSEYVSENEKRLEFISGFTGIVGQAIVTMISAYLFTDSRYWLQAQEQLGAGWTLIKVGAAGQPRDYIEWLVERTKGDKLGIDARLISHDKAVLLIKKMLSLKSNLVYPSQNLIDLIWDSKPAKSKAPIYIQPYEFTGMEATEKLRKLQEWIRQQPASMSAHSKASLNLSDMQVGTLISALPSIAYLLNLRGMDIPYSSVFHAYLFVGLDKIIIFIDYNKVTNEIREYIKSIGAQYQNYYEIWSFLKQRSWGEGKLLITPQTPYGISLMLAPDRYAVAPDFVQTMLSVKNKKEIDGLRKACLRDGVAYVRFLAWLEEKLHQHYEITEFEAVLRLAEFRRRNKNFISHTYKCISATGPNTALLSYKPKKTTARMIERDTPYLNDSGGLYKDGTCGVARTVHFGRPISEQCEVFTRVLQAHIAIDSAVFPEGISVNQLDILAHKAMWKDGFDIMRGSGQEFRPFLTVHESPQTFSSNNPLVPGHVVINEPGFYNEGRWGVRIESALIVRRVETKKRDFGDDSLLGFERLTCVPIQTQMVKTSMLAREEKQWLKKHNQRCLEKLTPLLKDDERATKWLKREVERTIGFVSEFGGMAIEWD